MFVRPVTFVDYFEIPNVKAEFSSNMCFYDVDGDGDIELIVAHWNGVHDSLNISESEIESFSPGGHLNIIKYDNIKWDTKVDGIITCICVGKVIGQINEPQILVFCGNCRLYCYYIRNEQDFGFDSTLEMVHTQIIPPNSKYAVIEDVDGDGINEIIVGCSDRTVRLFRWRDSSKTSDSDSSNDVIEHNTDDDVSGFEELICWELWGQVGRVCIHYSASDGCQILASQPGGSYAVLIWNIEGEEGVSEKKVPYVKYRTVSDEPKDSTAARNADLRSEIIGNIRRSKAEGTDGPQPYVAVCTIDGELVMIEGRDRLWQVRLGRGELFGLCKVDITNDESEEVVVCSWEGATYILNHRRSIARFQPSHRRQHYCQAFIAGKYAVAVGNNQPVLVYSILAKPRDTVGTLLIYYNLHQRLHRIPARNLIQELSTGLKNRIKSHNVHDQNQTRQFIQDVLYLWPTKHDYGDSDEFFEPDSDSIQSPLIQNRSNRSDPFNS